MVMVAMRRGDVIVRPPAEMQARLAVQSVARHARCLGMFFMAVTVSDLPRISFSLSGERILPTGDILHDVIVLLNKKACPR